MAQTKEKLVELIEAYAAAKGTGNAALTAMAAGALQQILLAVTFVEPVADQDFGVPEPTASRRAKRGVE